MRGKGTLLAVLVSVTVLAALAASADAGAASTVDARVESIATVLNGFVATNFEFDVYNCPAGAEMAVVGWEADQPAGGTGNQHVASGNQPFGLSIGEQVQHLTLTAGGNFNAGERWVGSGFFVCGTVVVPVEGSGQTVSLNGV
jgi:hypothetical protein